MSATEQLRSSALFADLDDEQVGHIAQLVRERTFDEGASLIVEGDARAGALWIIVAGSVDVVRGDTVVATLGPGQHVGEMALVSGEPRNASVTATEPTEALQLTSWDFRGLLAEHPDLSLAIMNALASRLDETDQRLSG